MAIGPILREARQQKQLTTSQVAEMTRMKVQIVDDLENDDFHRIAATIYGKGFIKLFAECIDLDPEPLIADYMEQVGSPQPPKLPTTKQQPEPIPPSPPPTDTGPGEDEEETTPSPDDLFAYAAQKPKRKRNVSADQVATTTPQPRNKPDARAWTEQCVTKARAYRQQAKVTVTKGLDVLTKKITESGEHDAWIQRGLIAIGILVVILILIPLVRMIAAPRDTASLPDDELILFVPAPEPYLE